MKRVLASALCASLSVLALSQATPIGPFVGAVSEGFEGFSAGTALTTSTPMLGGIGRFSFGNGTIYSPPNAPYNLNATTSAGVIDGSNGLGMTQDLIEFDYSGVGSFKKFGGFFASDPTQGLVVITFLANDGNLIDQVSFDYTGSGDLEWHGWSTTKEIGLIDINGTNMAMDGLQAGAAVPEPASMVALGLGAGVFIRRLRTPRPSGGEGQGRAKLCRPLTPCPLSPGGARGFRLSPSPYERR